MRTFRTQLHLRSQIGLISYLQKYFFIGSCFAESIELKMKVLGFQTVKNPFGAIYNPFSLRRSVDILRSSIDYKASDFQYRNGEFVSLDHHGRFSDVNSETLKIKLNSDLHETRKALQDVDVIFITLGIHGYFVFLEDGRIVNNCNKLDSRLFERRYGSLLECVEALERTVDGLREMNSEIKVVFTLSPVRYLGWGAAENSLGKSILRLSIDELCKSREYCNYFEASEIVLDDLRDYRFYGEDMIHPSSQAIDYIWDNLIKIGMSEVELPILREMEMIRKFLDHRYEGKATTEGDIRFIKKSLESIDSWNKEGKRFDQIREELAGRLL